MDYTDEVLALMHAFNRHFTRVEFAVVPGEPHSKARPRFAPNGRAYHDPKDKVAEQATGFRLKRIPMFTGNVALIAVFYRSTRRRVDVDNLLKHVCDAANGIVFKDDSQITSLSGVLELDADNPRTVLAFADHETTMTRGVDAVRPCTRCGSSVLIAAGRRLCGGCNPRLPRSA
jgi:Holliday junction resolvase RusA-like endonuclease